MRTAGAQYSLIPGKGVVADYDGNGVDDSEVDLVTGSGNERQYPIPPEKLRVFPEDDDLPGDEQNTSIDEQFVPMAKVTKEAGASLSWAG